MPTIRSDKDITRKSAQIFLKGSYGLYHPFEAYLRKSKFPVIANFFPSLLLILLYLLYRTTDPINQIAFVLKPYQMFHLFLKKENIFKKKFL